MPHRWAGKTGNYQFHQLDLNHDTDAMPVRHCESLDEAVEMVHDDPLRFEPGTEYRYSIWGWVLVSAVVEGAAGEPFDRFMARGVFAPLGMTHTVLEETAGLEDGLWHQSGSPRSRQSRTLARIPSSSATFGS